MGQPTHAAVGHVPLGQPLCPETPPFLNLRAQILQKEQRLILPCLPNCDAATGLRHLGHPDCAIQAQTLGVRPDVPGPGQGNGHLQN